MIERTVGSVTVLGPVRGLVSEATSVRSRLEANRPAALGIAISTDEMDGVREYFVGAPTEPVVPLAPTEAAEIRGLARYGEVSVPNPSVLTALRWADAASVPVSALDPDDDQYATWFAGSIGYFELVRRTLRERRLGKRPPEAPTADAFALAWSDTIDHGSGSRRLRARRDEAVVEGVAKLRARYPSVGVVVDRERFDGVVELLGGESFPVRTSGTVGAGGEPLSLERLPEGR